MRRLWTARGLVGAALAALLVAGCGSLEELQARDRTVRLQETVKVYVKALRWGEFGLASSNLRARDGQSGTRAAMPSPDELRVVSYKVNVDDVNPDATLARVSVAFSYYRTDASTLRSLRQQDLWWFSEDDDRWYLEGDLPAFGR